MYYTYILRCEDNSLYTGMTTDIERRMNEHFEQNVKCAKYTLRHKAKKLEMVWETSTRQLALRLEFYIKNKLTKAQKEKLIKNPELINRIFGDKIEGKFYKKIDNFS